MKINLSTKGNKLKIEFGDRVELEMPPEEARRFHRMLSAFLSAQDTALKNTEYYSILYHNKDTGEDVVSIVKAESHHHAEIAAKEDIKKWQGFTLCDVAWRDKKRENGGEAVCVY